MNKRPLTRYTQDIRRQMLLGAAVALLLVGGLGSWAALAEISGAVIASGRLVVVSEVKKVQHLTGGVVGEILVRNGSIVHAGQPLLRLDDTVTRANLGIVTSMLDELMARQARLRSERDGKTDIIFEPAFSARQSDAAISQIIMSEKRLFELRRAARSGNKAGLAERISQLRQEIAGLEEQIDSNRTEQALVNDELASTRQLWEKQLVQKSRLIALEREAVRAQSITADLVSRIAQTRGRIAEVELQILQIERDFNSDVARELREVDGKISELNERRIAAEDQLKRIDIVAPAAGVVNELTVHTVGGVIAPGEQLMSIVPDDDDLEVRALVRPTDVDQLRVGAPARLRLSAFSQRTTPELNGHLDWISSDVTVAESTGESHYEVRVSIDGGEAERLHGLVVKPGMPVEVFIKTSDRNVASLLLKPLTDHFYRALRED